MEMIKIKTAIVSVLTMIALMQTAVMAAEPKNTAPKPKYKKVTGEVVSASPSSIVIKGRSKDPVSLAITDNTDMIGSKSAKVGDRAAVNFKTDKNGNIATRIKVLSASTKSASPQPAASLPKSN